MPLKLKHNAWRLKPQNRRDLQRRLKLSVLPMKRQLLRPPDWRLKPKLNVLQTKPLLLKRPGSPLRLKRSAWRIKRRLTLLQRLPLGRPFQRSRYLSDAC
ncbi:hypothetical protein [Pseudomonas synxantha]|uniref:hypothetical protein n=1 Tax=Pseudomonas synxantha TaxID=47883 RepID=UPI0012F8F07A|nr:hypothetical protein [Pseudomonas synxantha]